MDLEASAMLENFAKLRKNVYRANSQNDREKSIHVLRET